MGEAVSIVITAIYSPAPRVVNEWRLTMCAASTVLDALEASGIRVGDPNLDLRGVSTGVWGRKVAVTHVLRDNDRVEIYRPLVVDPKVARRERFRKQGSRGAGLFAKRRTGAKAGY